MIHIGDCIESMRKMESGSVNTCVTSPPYFGLRDYGHDGQIGLEETPSDFVAKLVEVFAEVHRVLRDDGTLWLTWATATQMEVERLAIQMTSYLSEVQIQGRRTAYQKRT